MGRADHDVAGDLAAVEFAEGREGDAEFFVDAGESKRLGVEHHGKAGGGEGAENLLAFTEAVAEEGGRGAVGDGLAAESDEVGDDLGLGWHDVAREGERRFHDQRVGLRRGARLGGETGTEFEIAGVEERAVFRGREMDLRRAEDVAGGMKRGGDAEFEFVGNAEREFGDEAFAGDARVEETRSAGRAEHFRVTRDVVGMGVRNERAGDARLRVEPPADLRQVDALAVDDFPGCGH